MSNSTYLVREVATKKVVNFYSTEIKGSLHWANDCKRQMKALSGKEHEVVVKTEGEEPIIQEVKEFLEIL